MVKVPLVAGLSPEENAQSSRQLSAYRDVSGSGGKQGSPAI